MLRERRYAKITEQLRISGAATIDELSAVVGVSGSTIRRDLNNLSDRGMLQLTRGGATLVDGYFASFELDSKVAVEVAPEAKAAIGDAAAAMVHSGQTIIFDSSTTVLAAAHRIAQRDIELTAITNSLQIAEALSAARRVSVIVAGGTVRRRSPTLIGNPGLAFFGELHADLLFLGTHAISGNLLTETSQEVVSIKRAMIAAANRTVLLADGTKFRRPALFTICSLEKVETLITNSAVDSDALKLVREQGVVVHQV